MAVTVLDDDAVAAALDPATAVAVARDALIAAYQGTLAAPPRHAVDAGVGTLVFTVGGTADVAGFRCYETWKGGSDQLVAVWDASGALLGITVGGAIGAMRTGALGGAAVDVLARADAGVATIVGAGLQAWTQLWALTAVRDLTDVRVASRTPSRRDAFVERARRELDLPARAVDDVAEAVRGADVVVLATRATEPLIDVADLAPGCHVTSVGPKRVGATEIPAALLGAAAVVASDSPQQLMADPDLLTNAIDVRHVGAIASGADAGRRTADDLTVYCSAGLAGSEVLLARAALQRAAEHAYDTSG